MKLFYQVNKALFVIAMVCFIFIVLAANNLSAHGAGQRTVLYDKNDCNGKLLIQETGRSIYIRSKAEEFHPGPVAKMFIE